MVNKIYFWRGWTKERDYILVRIPIHELHACRSCIKSDGLRQVAALLHLDGCWDFWSLCFVLQWFRLSIDRVIVLVIVPLFATARVLSRLFVYPSYRRVSWVVSAFVTCFQRFGACLNYRIEHFLILIHLLPTASVHRPMFHDIL